MHIRAAEPGDRDQVKALYLAAFPEAEREVVAGLAVELLGEKSQPETFALVAVKDGELVGHVSFSPVKRKNIDEVVGYILAPLAVHPDSQRQGIGSRLIETGQKRLTLSGEPLLFVYGDPQYYRRFGFNVDLAKGYRPPFRLQYEFGWQARTLTEEAKMPPAAELKCVSSLMNPQLW